MQSNASALESDRRVRLDAIEARERREQEEDDKRRSGKGRFVGAVRSQAEGVDLGRRLQDRRRGLDGD